MDRAEKQELVSTLNDTFKSTGVVVVAHYAGLSVSDMTTLRGKMKEAGAQVKVAKNRLAKIALEGTDLAHMTSLFEGQTLIAYSDDPVAAPKVATEYAKTKDKLVVLGGGMGQTALDADGVKALASLPSLDELRAKIVGMVQTPASRIAQVVQAPGGQVARVIQAYADKGEAA
ncbi:50S ribosomal protein L10 [Tepidamorphus sp. 3E244]|uniref:50S ribosomal protein L10 n=1 Tax=Tepidamorphus sp. 3E244 TaxID=3385498 RepID=UPI0038FC13C6